MLVKCSENAKGLFKEMHMMSKYALVEDLKNVKTLRKLFGLKSFCVSFPGLL